MDMSRYAPSLQELDRRHREYIRSADPRAVTVLQKMLKNAQALHDPELIGYVYHSLAFAEHFIRGRYQAFIKYLRLSLQHILRCKDQAELLHVYYLVAIDAMNKGLYDISYHYFQEASHIAGQTGGKAEMAILEESIAHILLLIDRFPESRRIMKKSLQEIRKHKDHPHYYSNMASGYMNEAIACLEMGKRSEAKKAMREVGQLINEAQGTLPGGTHLNYAILHLRMQVTDKASKKAEESLKKVIALLSETQQLHLYTDELQKLCNSLSRAGKKEWVGRILNAIGPDAIEEDAVFSLRTITDLRIDYYAQTGKKKELEECYREQDRVNRLLINQQKNVSNYVRELAQLTNDLQKEREEAFEEKEKLQTMARVDELTGIANRFEATERLEEAFEQARRNQRNLGIAYLDVDELKYINDTQGHLAGDRCLMELGIVLRTRAREGGYLPARYGGDEFILIFEGKDTKEIRACVKALREETSYSFSAGIYNAVPGGGQRSWEFLAMADKALYREKRSKAI